MITSYQTRLLEAICEKLGIDHAAIKESKPTESVEQWQVMRRRAAS